MDFYIGHSAHVVQEFEIYKGKPIFYGIGNSLFDMEFTKTARIGLAPILSWKMEGGKWEVSDIQVHTLLTGDPSNDYKTTFAPLELDFEVESWKRGDTKALSRQLSERLLGLLELPGPYYELHKVLCEMCTRFRSYTTCTWQMARVGLFQQMFFTDNWNDYKRQLLANTALALLTIGLLFRFLGSKGRLFLLFLLSSPILTIVAYSFVHVNHHPIHQN